MTSILFAQSLSSIHRSLHPPCRLSQQWSRDLPIYSVVSLQWPKVWLVAHTRLYEMRLHVLIKNTNTKLIFYLDKNNCSVLNLYEAVKAAFYYTYNRGSIGNVPPNNKNHSRVQSTTTTVLKMVYCSVLLRMEQSYKIYRVLILWNITKKHKIWEIVQPRSPNPWFLLVILNFCVSISDSYFVSVFFLE